MMACPHCNANNDMHAESNGRHSEPVAGDVSVCWHCRGVGIYVEQDGELVSAAPTKEEMRLLMADDEFRAQLAAVQTVIGLSATPQEAFRSLN